MGQYGKIMKIVVNTTKAYKPKATVGVCYSAYITYSSYREAAVAILVYLHSFKQFSQLINTLMKIDL